jgi:hypothetical protein
VYALSITAAGVGPSPVWQRALAGGASVSHMVVGPDGAVYVAASDVRVVALSAADGSLLWSVPVFGDPFAPLLLFNTTLVAVTGSRIFALDAARNGSVLWSVDAPAVARFSGAAAIDASGSLVVPTTVGSYLLYARCAPGHACPAPSVEVRCPAGSVSEGDARACTPCPAGTYNPALGAINAASACAPCPPGMSSPEGSVACERLLQAAVAGTGENESTGSEACPLKRFPSADLAGDRLEALSVGTEAECASICCARPGGACAGFSFCRLGGALPSCTLLANVTHVVPSSIMSSGVRASLLGL